MEGGGSVKTYRNKYFKTSVFSSSLVRQRQRKSYGVKIITIKAFLPWVE